MLAAAIRCVFLACSNSKESHLAENVWGHSNALAGCSWDLAGAADDEWTHWSQHGRENPTPQMCLCVAQTSSTNCTRNISSAVIGLGRDLENQIFASWISLWGPNNAYAVLGCWCVVIDFKHCKFLWQEHLRWVGVWEVPQAEMPRNMNAAQTCPASLHSSAVNIRQEAAAYLIGLGKTCHVWR